MTVAVFASLIQVTLSDANDVVAWLGLASHQSASSHRIRTVLVKEVVSQNKKGVVFYWSGDGRVYKSASCAIQLSAIIDFALSFNQGSCLQSAHLVLIKTFKMHEQDIVAAIELAFYISTTILAVFVCARHGFNRSSGWIYTLILCIVRIVGAIIQLQSRHNPSNGLIEARIIVDSIGISPLLLATLGLLSRL